MKIYESEKAVAHLMQENKSVAYTAEIMGSEQVDLSKFVRANEEERKKSPDLYRSFSLLVSSVWNANDDVFSSPDIFAARTTPNNHPTNIDHNQLDIVGHITNTWVVDADMNVLAEDTPDEELPELIHLINESVIYTHFEDQEKLEAVFSLLDEIESGQKFVSMEALFSDFDYAIKDAEGNMTILARNEKTAFLTQHLRAYGGRGRYQGFLVGRLLKDFVFVGKGYVDTPANKASVVFTEGLPFASASVKTDINELDGVQLNNETLENLNMSKELETKLVEANTKIAELTAALEEAKAGNMQAELDELKALKDQLVSDLQAAKDAETNHAEQLDAANTAKTAAETKLEEVTASLAEAKEALAQAADEQKRIERITSLVAAGTGADKAAELVEQFFNLDDEQWATLASIMVVPKATSESSTASTEANDDNEDDVEDVEVDPTATASNNLNADEPNEVEERAERMSTMQSSVATLLKITKESN